jgi:NhaC family Na+:H+ antiporter
MAAGTVPAIVYYGLKYISPNLFILSAFIVSSTVSLLIGTSFGTVGTVGIALIVMARSGNVSITATAGAIIAGAYLGDRGSPMSSSANLVAHITETNLYTNIKNMVKTAVIPFVISIIAYTLISLRNPISTTDSRITTDISSYFNLGTIAVIPAIVILVLSLFKINVKLSMLISVISATIISVVFQNNGVMDTVEYILSGYKIKGDSYLADILVGGGIMSMLKVSVIVFISSGFTGIFEGTGMLKAVEKYTGRASTIPSRFLTTIIVSIVTAAFGCTQVMAVMLTHMLMKKAYEKNKSTAEEMAVDLENTAIVIAPLIPWNIAVLVPLTTLNVGIAAIPFAIFLYVLPVYNLIEKLYRLKRR